MTSAWIMPVLCFQGSMGFPGPGISLVPSPTGSGRKAMRRVTLVPGRKEHQKVSTPTYTPYTWCCCPTREGQLSWVLKTFSSHSRGRKSPCSAPFPIYPGRRCLHWLSGNPVGFLRSRIFISPLMGKKVWCEQYTLMSPSWTIVLVCETRRNEQLAMLVDLFSLPAWLWWSVI